MARIGRRTSVSLASSNGQAEDAISHNPVAESRPAHRVRVGHEIVRDRRLICHRRAFVTYYGRADIVSGLEI
jgi:hypothetical protein